MQLSSYKYFYLAVCCSSIIFIFPLFFNHVPDFPSNSNPFGWLKKGPQQCQIPRLDPFQSEAMYLLKKSPPKSEKDICGTKHPLLFESQVSPTLGSLIVPAISNGDFERIGISSCCYRVMTTAPKNGYNLSDTCAPLSLRKPNKIPDDCEFAVVYCSRFTPIYYPNPFYGKSVNTPSFVDIHYFVPLKPEVEKRLESKSLPPSEDRLNVLIIGIDAVSRSHMIRSMPKSYKFLMEDLEAVDMKGYNKVAYNTFPCMLPLFLSMHQSEVYRRCASYSGRFDSCPFIWKAFAEKGYRTSYHEDVPTLSIFRTNDNLTWGFRDQPTDYYNLGPMTFVFENGRGNEICNGPRLTNTLLLDYVKKFVLKMDSERKSYFHFLWSTGLTHDLLENALSQDVPLSGLLKWLKFGSHLNNTALVVLSDHGFHFIEEVYTGLASPSLEAHLPFMFLVLPQSFKRKYAEAYRNLQGNSDYYLTTTFDLHQTLLDILEPARLQRDQLALREQKLKDLECNDALPRGISQFLPVPQWRTCEDAGIPARHCACLGTWEDVSVEQEEVFQAAKFAVREINKLLRSSPNNNCSNLLLSKILSAKMSVAGGGRKFKMKREKVKISLLLQFETRPGAGLFEAQVFEQERKFAIMKEIIRLDRYSIKGHGDCVKGQSIEKFCYCK